MTTLAHLNNLLDEALAMSPLQRRQWLDQLHLHEEPLCLRVRDLLSRATRLEREQFLETLPKVTQGIAEAVAMPPSAEVGPYRLVREIARGGMGSVWLAERTDGLVKRPVAVKLPRNWSRYCDLAERMGREREILSALNPPNIARLYDAGLTADGQPWLALEYVEGVPIDVYCTQRQLDARQRLQLFLKVANAVAHAHAKLIVHRDLKPANVLVTEDGEVRLLDFGIAKLIEPQSGGDASQTEFSGRALTIDYASPEQIRGESISIATDVYSLGVMLFELLAGARPHRAADGSRHAVETAILHQEPVKPSEVASREMRRQLRGDLDTIVLHALRKKPEGRYATVNAFADDVTRYLSGRPVQARPDSVWYRFGKFVGRNRLASVIAGVLLLVMLFITMATIALARSAIVDTQRLEVVKSLFSVVFLHVDPRRPDGISLQTLETALLDASRQTAVSVSPHDYLRMRLEMRLALVQRRLNNVTESDWRIGNVIRTLERSGSKQTEEYVSAKLLEATFAMEDGRLQESQAAEALANQLAPIVPKNDQDLTVQARRLLVAAKEARAASSS
ncbi:MAG TPA: serine/threonine-protein kinase [Povalibacter sp.]